MTDPLKLDAEGTALARAVLSLGPTELAVRMLGNWMLTTGALLALVEQFRDIVESVDQHGRCTIIVQPGDQIMEAFSGAIQIADAVRADMTQDDLRELGEILKC